MTQSKTSGPSAKHLDARHPDAQHVDLETLRETLRYMHDDIGARPGMERIAAAMKTVVSEIELAEARASLPKLQIIRNARFVARTY